MKSQPELEKQLIDDLNRAYLSLQRAYGDVRRVHKISPDLAEVYRAELLELRLQARELRKRIEKVIGW